MAADLVTRAARATPPGGFAITMATGIVSAAVKAAGADGLALALLVLAALSFAVVLGLTAVRAARFGSEFRGDLRDPAIAFTAFTLVAACDVLAGDLTGGGARGARGVAAALGVAGLAAWALLTVAVPGRLAARPGGVPPRAVSGSWYLWVVAVQSLVIVAADLGAARPGPWHAVAVAGWCAGAAGYLVVSGLVVSRLARAGLGSDDPTAPYWVAMGAASITVLAAASLLASAPPGRPGWPAWAGWLGWLAAVFWVVATCLIAPLACRSVLRHLRWRQPLRYRADLWMIVFPAGMYATAGMRLGAAAGFTVAGQAGRAAAWPAFAAWAVLAAALAVTLVRHARAPASPHSSPPFRAQLCRATIEGARQAGGQASRRAGEHQGMAMTAKPYKFQAFVTVTPDLDASPPGPAGLACSTLPPGQLRRMALRGEHHRTHGTHFFSALVANSGDSLEWIGDNHAIVTVMLRDEDAEDYFCAGDHFALWLGHDIADGIVTRRLYV